jgi:hypothetical protein
VVAILCAGIDKETAVKILQLRYPVIEPVIQSGEHLQDTGFACVGIALALDLLLARLAGRCDASGYALIVDPFLTTNQRQATSDKCIFGEMPDLAVY